MIRDSERMLVRSSAKHARRRLQRLLIVGALIILMVSSVGRLWNVWQVQRELGRLESRIESARLVNEQLRHQVESLQGLDYVEKVARDELGLVRPGEITYMTIRNQEPRR